MSFGYWPGPVASFDINDIYAIAQSQALLPMVCIPPAMFGNVVEKAAELPATSTGEVGATGMASHVASASIPTTSTSISLQRHVRISSLLSIGQDIKEAGPHLMTSRILRVGHQSMKFLRKFEIL